MKKNLPINISKLEEKLFYKFIEKDYLICALKHSSYANEKKQGKNSSYERIEFLGDSILNLVISEYLFINYPDLPEGELTRNRSKIVCEPTLAKFSRCLDIGSFLLLGKGEANTGGKDRESILADVFESIIGAIHLDGGFNSAKEFVLKNMEEYIKELLKGSTLLDYKTILQELVQRTDDKIVYEIIEEIGPDHDKVFVAQISISDKVSGVGKGRTKKEAEQNAAKVAYEDRIKI